MGKSRTVAFRRVIRVFALLGFAFAVVCAMLFGTYFAHCGIPMLWEQRWHMCATALWDNFLEASQADWRAKLLLSAFGLLEFTTKLLFVLAFLWLFVTTLAGRFTILLFGFLFGLAQRLLTDGQRSFHAELGWYSVLIAVLIGFAAGASYRWLQTRTQFEWSRWISPAMWGILSILLMASQPIAALVLAMLADPRRLLQDMRLPEPAIEAVLSVCFFALYYGNVQRFDAEIMRLIGFIVLSSAIFPALHSALVGNPATRNTA